MIANFPVRSLRFGGSSIKVTVGIVTCNSTHQRDMPQLRQSVELLDRDRERERRRRDCERVRRLRVQDLEHGRCQRQVLSHKGPFCYHVLASFTVMAKVAIASRACDGLKVYMGVGQAPVR